MAARMMCPAHGPVEGQSCIPGCLEPLQPFVTPPAAFSATCEAAGCGMSLPCPLHAAGAPDAGHRELAAYLAAPRPAASPGAPVGGGALEFPWGTVAIPAGGLTVGRDFGGVCGTQIDTFDNVSRKHARIVLEDGQLSIEDLDSTNGTTINGIATTPGHRQLLCHNDVIDFGNRLRATVTVSRG